MPRKVRQNFTIPHGVWAMWGNGLQFVLFLASPQSIFHFSRFFFFGLAFLQFNWIVANCPEIFTFFSGVMGLPGANLNCQNCNELFGVSPIQVDIFNPFRWHKLHWNVIKIETRSSLCFAAVPWIPIPNLQPFFGWLWMTVVDGNTGLQG